MSSATSTPKRLICDPHHHLWTPSTHSWWHDTAWQKTVADGVAGSAIFAEKYRIYGASEFRAESKKYELDKSVYLECSYDSNEMSEVEYVQKLGDLHGGIPTGIIGAADLERDDIEDVLESYMKCSRFRGIRASICWNSKYPSRSWANSADTMMSPKFIRGLKVMAKHALILDLHVYPEQLQCAAVIAAALPDLRIVVNHCGYPLIESLSDLMEWQKGMQLMSRCSNVYVKLSGWCIADKWFNIGSMKYLSKYLLDCFGVDRCMFASNFPVDKPYGSYDFYWDSYIQIARELGYDEKDIDKLIHDNAVRVYRLNGNASSIASKL